MVAIAESTLVKGLRAKEVKKKKMAWVPKKVPQGEKDVKAPVL
jgi:hypothetical protein